jgi:hypothetical protein
VAVGGAGGGWPCIGFGCSRDAIPFPPCLHWLVLRRALDGVDDEYIDRAALRVEFQSELFLQRRID